MRRHSFFQFVLTMVLAIVCFVWPARAQSSRTWVASNGTANGTCDRANPCQTFQQAYAVTLPGGEISCVDGGEFSGFGITHSITIDCTASHGLLGTVTISGTAATDAVVLKGLDFDGAGGSTTSAAVTGFINFSGAGSLYVEKVKINNLGGNSRNGIYFQPNGAAKLHVADSSITNMGTAGTVAGIYIKPASGVMAKVTVERSRIDNNFFGIVADGSAGGIVRGIVRDSYVTGNVNNGVTLSTNTSSVVLALDNVTIANNNFGLAVAGANAGMLVSRSFITANGTGVFASGGALLSYRDNRLNANTSDGAFTGFVAVQ